MFPGALRNSASGQGRLRIEVARSTVLGYNIYVIPSVRSRVE